MRWLTLHKNKLKHLPPNIFKNQQKLQNLSLFRNKLEFLPSGIFENLTSLERVYLSVNNLQQVPSGIFRNLTFLEEIWLDHNNLTKIHHSAFEGLESLTYLILKNNNLTKLATKSFKGLKNLYYLDISFNKLESVQRGIFGDQTNLKALILEHNNLHGLSLGSVKGLTSIRIMHLHENYMTTLPDKIFDEMKRLERVTVDTSMMCCFVLKEEANCEYHFPNSFSNCERPLKDPGPRYCIWIIATLSQLGNILVIVRRFWVPDRSIVQSIMLINLAMADALMGVYLTIIGSIDVQWAGEYYKHDFSWRSGIFCEITGALSVLSSEVSVMTLVLITVDRLINIVYPFRFTGFTRKRALISCATAWVIGIILAFLPMLGLEYFFDVNRQHGFYGRSVVCVPLQVSFDLPAGWQYSAAIFIGFNLTCFLLMLIAYLTIIIKSYLSSRRAQVGADGKRSNRMRKREISLAKRSFFIVATDLCCWLPIGILGMRSIFDKNCNPSGNVTVWIAVFVLPINSAINPVLYTLSTPAVQKAIRTKLQKLWNFLAHLVHNGNEDQELQEAGEPQGQAVGVEGNLGMDEEQDRYQQQGQDIEMNELRSIQKDQGEADQQHVLAIEMHEFPLNREPEQAQTQGQAIEANEHPAVEQEGKKEKEEKEEEERKGKKEDKKAEKEKEEDEGEAEKEGHERGSDQGESNEVPLDITQTHHTEE